MRVWLCPIDPNNDRFEQWEQEVCGPTKQLATLLFVHNELAVESTVCGVCCASTCWIAFSVGIEVGGCAVGGGKVRTHDSNDRNSNNDRDEDEDNGIPKMRLVNYCMATVQTTLPTHSNFHSIPFPSSVTTEEDRAVLYECCVVDQLSPQLLTQTFSSVSHRGII